uniref:Uncharacterized protein n=1 Tax=Meloidogyne enterolobii TaxID=390850 RepID=A0A6V7TP19_MELEN|nr:unnamed protein product [Meloidogyne enterolobii]
MPIKIYSRTEKASRNNFYENEFDKAFVDLDVLIGEFEQENSELSFECRRRLTRISGIFVQFVHKVAVMNQRNCELEKDLQNSNNKLIGVLATNSLLEEQSEQLLLRVHSLSCQLYSKTAPHESEIIKKKLDKEMRMFNTKNLPITKSQAEISLLKEENLKLKSLLNSVHSEIYGARLAAKYLDKELAGRIQQIQLLGRNMRGSQYDSLWNRLESEIHLNRHKTFVKTCYVPDVKDFLRQQNDLKHQKPTTSKNKNSSLHSNKKCLPIFPLLSPCSPSSSNNSETSTCNSLCEQHFERPINKTLKEINSCSPSSSVSYESATDECNNNSNIKLCLEESLNVREEVNDK